MPTPGEHKTVQARILEYVEAIGWTRVSREETERRCGFDPGDPPAERARIRSLKKWIRPLCLVNQGC
jgi:type I restriction enzyme R subunit